MWLTDTTFVLVTAATTVRGDKHDIIIIYIYLGVYRDQRPLLKHNNYIKKQSPFSIICYDIIILRLPIISDVGILYNIIKIYFKTAGP